jgi:hypothetical protein
MRSKFENTTLPKGGAQIARTEPDEKKVCTGRDLAAALAKVRLTPEESRAWLRDLRAARKFLLAPIDKWR